MRRLAVLLALLVLTGCSSPAGPAPAPGPAPGVTTPEPDKKPPAQGPEPDPNAPVVPQEDPQNLGANCEMWRSSSVQLPLAGYQDLYSGGIVKSGICGYTAAVDGVHLLFWLPASTSEEAARAGLTLPEQVEAEVSFRRLPDQAILSVRLSSAPKGQVDTVALSGPFGPEGQEVTLGFALRREQQQAVTESRSTPQLVALDPASGTEQVIGEAPVDIENAWLSPDGRWAMLPAWELLEWGRDIVWIMDTSSGERYQTPFRYSHWTKPPVWTNGKAILAGINLMQVFDLERKEAAVRLSGGIYWYEVSPDGRHLPGIALNWDRADGQGMTPVSVVLYDLVTGTERVYPDVAKAWVPGSDGPPKVKLGWDGAKLVVSDATGARPDLIGWLSLDISSGAVQPHPGLATGTPRELQWVTGPGDWSYYRSQPWTDVVLKSPAGLEQSAGQGLILGWRRDGRLLVIRWADSHRRRIREGL